MYMNIRIKCLITTCLKNKTICQSYYTVLLFDYLLLRTTCIVYENGKFEKQQQIEGAPFEDGRGLSNWDVFSHTPGIWSLLISLHSI